MIALRHVLRLLLVASAFVAAGPAYAADAPTRVYLLMGQSNMAGRGALDADAAAASDPRILALAPDGTWVAARDPLHVKIGRTEPGVGPGLAFARARLAADSAATIGLIPCAVGGSPLKRWVKGGDLYEQAVARAKAAAPAAALAGVLWHQGETDSDKLPWAETYEQRLAGMIAALRADLGRPDLPVAVGQLGEFLTVEKHPGVETVRAAIRKVAATVPGVAYVDSAGLGHKGDGLHFDTPAARELGRRYAAAFASLGLR